MFCQHPQLLLFRLLKSLVSIRRFTDLVIAAYPSQHEDLIKFLEQPQRYVDQVNFSKYSCAAENDFSLKELGVMLSADSLPPKYGVASGRGPWCLDCSTLVRLVILGCLMRVS